MFRMFPRLLFFVTLAVACLQSSDSLAARFFPPERITGAVDAKVVRNSVVLTCEIQFNDFLCDSAWIVPCLDKQDCMQALIGEADGYPLQALESASDSLYGKRWKGRFTIPGYADIPHEYYIGYRISANDPRFPDSVGFSRVTPIYPKNNLGRRDNIGILQYRRSGFPSPAGSSDKGALLQVEDRVSFFDRRYGFSIGYSINHGDQFSLYEYGRLELGLVPFGRDKWLTEFYFAGNYTRVRGGKDDTQYIEKGFGVESGVRIEGKFERFQYSYNTAAGGYHRFDLMFAIISSAGGQKIGTQYTVFNGKFVKMAGISISMVGWGESEPMQYTNNRPIIHKAVAILALIPFIPLALGAAG